MEYIKKWYPETKGTPFLSFEIPFYYGLDENFIFSDIVVRKNGGEKS